MKRTPKFGGGLAVYWWPPQSELTSKTPPYLDMLEAKIIVSHRSEPSQARKMGMEESGKVGVFRLVAFLSWIFTIRVIRLLQMKRPAL